MCVEAEDLEQLAESDLVIWATHVDAVGERDAEAAVNSDCASSLHEIEVVDVGTCYMIPERSEQSGICEGGDRYVAGFALGDGVGVDTVWRLPSSDELQVKLVFACMDLLKLVHGCLADDSGNTVVHADVDVNGHDYPNYWYEEGRLELRINTTILLILVFVNN